MTNNFCGDRLPRRDP